MRLVKEPSLTSGLLVTFTIGSEAALPLLGGGKGVGQIQGACRNRQATVRKKQVVMPAFFVPLRGQFYEPFLRDLELIRKLEFILIIE